MRKPFQGVWNIIRFNWHFFAAAFGLALLLYLFTAPARSSMLLARNIAVLVILILTSLPLAISCYVYDFSSLYKLRWLDDVLNPENKQILNIHAGFDETSYLLERKFPNAELMVLDFYDPSKHTEVSIKRARKAYPPFPGTRQMGKLSLLST